MRPLILPVLALLGLPLACAAPEHPDAALEASPLGEPAGPPRAATPAAGTPTRIPLAVRETAGVARAGEVVRSGVPLPRALGVRDPRSLAVVGADGKPVPAEFHVLARWNAGKDDAAAPVQWVLVVFPATVAARGSAVYTLVADGSAGPNPPPPTPLRLSRQGEQVVVDTGAATFRLGGNAGGAVRRDARCRTAGTRDRRRHDAPGGGAEGGTRRARPADRVPGALSAVVVIDGAYDLPPVGGGRFRLAPAVRLHRRLPHRGGAPRPGLGGGPRLHGVPQDQGRQARRRPRRTGARHAGARPGSPKPAAVTVVGAFKEPALEAAAAERGKERRRTSPGAPDPARPPRRAAPFRDDGRRPAPRGEAGGRRPARRLRPRGLGRRGDQPHAPLRAAVPTSAGRRPPRRRSGGRQGLARQPPGDVRDPGGDRPAGGGEARRPRPAALGPPQPAAARLAGRGLVHRLRGGRRGPRRPAPRRAWRPTTS